MPLDQFAALVRRAEVPLGLACATIAAHLGHRSEVAVTTRQLDALAVEVAARCSTDGRGVDLGAIADQLFGPLGFRGNRERYGDPRNSLLPDVLRRRTGIPITLSIVVLEVAGRLGVPAVGVGMPGHFLVGEGRRPRRWLDPFDGGRWLDRRGAEQRFHQVQGPRARFDDAFLAPTAGTDIIARVLANLASVERAEGDARALVRVLELRSQIPVHGSSVPATAELAESYAAVGRVGDAIAALASVRPRIDPRHRDTLDGRIAELRASLN